MSDRDEDSHTDSGDEYTDEDEEFEVLDESSLGEQDVDDDDDVRL